MGNLASDTPSKMTPPARDFKNGALSAESGLEALSHNAGERIGAMASQISDSASDYAKSGREYVKENPVAGIAMAAAAGAIAGSLITLIMRRRSHRE